MGLRRPCSRSGCPNLVTKGYCDTCAPKHSAAAIAEQARPSAAARGYGRTWQKASSARLKSHPFCADPFGMHEPFPVPADCTDHVIPHKGDMTLFWDPNNWQSLCRGCNSLKAAKEEGGFGNRSR